MKRFAIMMLIFALMNAGCGQAAQLLEDGAAGETVLVLTRRLCELGFIAEAVSEYGDDVVSAIGDFQTANGMERTGIADIETQQKMNASDVVTRSDYIAAFAVKYAGKNVTTGSSGEDVLNIQKALVELGFYDNTPDGKFGEGTRRAVVDYQEANGLEATGIADASMFLRLFEGESVNYTDYVNSHCAVSGDSGAHVRAIQDRLSKLGYYSGDATATYGDNTARAVRRFQSDNDLPQTGDVDADTYEALFDPDAQHVSINGTFVLGDSGDEVFAIQQQLAELGFYRDDPDGVFDRATETAVMLFRAANGLEILECADSEVLEKLNSGAASDLSALAETSMEMDGIGQELVSARAKSLVGIEFITEGGLFPGFDFVQYVFAGCGVDVGDPSYAIERLGTTADAREDMAEGNVLVMGRVFEDELLLYFAVCVGDDQVVYADGETGTVVQAGFDDIQHTSAYVWKIGL